MMDTVARMNAEKGKCVVCSKTCERARSNYNAPKPYLCGPVCKRIRKSKLQREARRAVRK